MGSNDRLPKLRLMSYLAPGVPVAVFDAVRDLLEAKTGRDVYLILESRWSGPPSGREDPFVANDVDLAFMCSTAYLRLRQKRNPSIELCHAAPLYAHPMAATRPVYFSELMVHRDNRGRFPDVRSLRGCRWTYNDDISLSGNIMMLAELRRQGCTQPFFSSTIQSGSHHASLQSLQDGTADVATIDSTTITHYSRQHPELAARLHRVASLGPMPVQPLIFNSRLPDALKAGITSALLKVDEDPDWGPRFRALGVEGFSHVDDQFYTLDTDIRHLVENL